MCFEASHQKASFFMKKYFVALEADTYEIDAEKISLAWGQTVSEWLNVMQRYPIRYDDVVIGHSVGATIAALYGKGRVVALSPSPITEETKHLIADVPDADLPFAKEEKKHFLKETDVKIYVGEYENEIIKDSARILAEKTGGSITLVPRADHIGIVESTKEEWANI